MDGVSSYTRIVQDFAAVAFSLLLIFAPIAYGFIVQSLVIVFSSFAIISLGKRGRYALLLLSSWCQQCVLMAFSSHMYLLVVVAKYM